MEISPEVLKLPDSSLLLVEDLRCFSKSLTEQMCKFEAKLNDMSNNIQIILKSSHTVDREVGLMEERLSISQRNVVEMLEENHQSLIGIENKVNKAVDVMKGIAHCLNSLSCKSFLQSLDENEELIDVSSSSQIILERTGQ